MPRLGQAGFRRWWLYQPVQALQRAGPARRVRGRRREPDPPVPALPHLSRQRHEPAQAASIAAWNDEAHVIGNRQRYRAKFAAGDADARRVLDVALPDAVSTSGPVSRAGDDVGYAQRLLAQYNVQVLPGSLLARQSGGLNPGAGRVRQALVADEAECLKPPSASSLHPPAFSAP